VVIGKKLEIKKIKRKKIMTTKKVKKIIEIRKKCKAVRIAV